MARPSRAALGDRLAAVDRVTLVAFVADLYAARGATVERLDERDRAVDLVVTDGPDVHRIAVRVDTAEPATDADTVVTVTGTPPPTDATVVTVADLHEWLWYAIPRDRAEHLLAMHLDCRFDDLAAADPAGTGDPLDADGGGDDATGTDPDSPAAHPTTGVTGTDGDDDEAPRFRVESVGASTPGRTAAVVRPSDDTSPSEAGSGLGSGHGVDIGAIGLGVLALLVVAATVASGPGVPLGASLIEAVGGDDGGERPAPTNESREPRSSIDVTATDLPPGVSVSGELDERVLAEATTAQLRNRSYRLTLVYREFVDGEPGGFYSEVVRVESGREYRADVTRAGEFVRSPPTIAETDRYANGTVSRRYENGESTVTSGALSPSDPFEDELAQYLRWYLSVEDSYITDRTGTGDATTYRINIDGDPFAGVANTTGSALVTRDGLVWSVRRSYDDPYHEDVRAVVTIRITGVGSTTAPEPDWAE